MKLKAGALGLAFGLIWGAAVFLTTLVSYYTGYARLFLEVVQSFYPGYSITPIGSLVGLAYGFVDGLVCGALTAWVYNKIAGH